MGKDFVLVENLWAKDYVKSFSRFVNPSWMQQAISQDAGAQPRLAVRHRTPIFMTPAGLLTYPSDLMGYTTKNPPLITSKIQPLQG